MKPTGKVSKVSSSSYCQPKAEPESVLVVGDNPDSEIQAGNALGMRTVQILRPGIPRGDNATYYIQTLAELKALVRGNG